MTNRSPVDVIIARAVANGEFDNLPGAGKRLVLDDEAGVPDDMRLSFRVLKRYGAVPPEVEEMNKLAELRAAFVETTDPEERKRLGKIIAERDSILQLKLERMRRR